MGGGRASRIVGASCLVLVLILASVNFYVIRSSNRAPDDAYISLRYARHLAEGEGFRFNPGGEKVEGFSSPLHVMTMAALIRAGFDPLAVSQATSLLAALLTVMLTAWWGQRRLGPLWGTLAGAAVALHPGLGTWARGGLETTGFTLLVLVLFVLGAEGRWRAAAAAAGLLAVARPEGILYWAPLFGYAAFQLWREGRSLREILPMGALAVALSLPWLVFRMAYFGDWLPNTYYAKMDGVRSDQVARGFDYLASFLAGSEILVPLVLGLAGLAALFLVRGNRDGGMSGWPILVFGTGLAACAAIFVLSAGGDWMTNHRFLVPVVPLVMLAGAAAGRLLSRSWPLRPVSLGVTILAGFLFISQPGRIFSHDLRHPTYPLDRPLGLVEPWDDSDAARLFRFGEEMRGIMKPHETLALVPVGAPAYASERHVIDMLGLNDREIAHLPVTDMGKGVMGHEKGDSRIILARRPDFVVLRHNPNDPVDEICPPTHELKYAPVRQIWEDEAFHLAYEPFLVPISESRCYTVYRRVAGR